MSLQQSEGLVHISADDFQQTVDGITYGIKLRYLPALGNSIALMLEKVDGDWVAASVIDPNVESGIVRAGSPALYAENVIRPAARAWLASRRLQKPLPAQEVAALVGKWVVL